MQVLASAIHKVIGMLQFAGIEACLMLGTAGTNTSMRKMVIVVRC